MSDNLERFKAAQRGSYDSALREIQNGRKNGHWMWYIFPQLRGLGRSPTSEYYGNTSLEEAKAYLQDELLGAHLREITSVLL